MISKSKIVAGALFMLAAAASPASAVTVGPHSTAPVTAEGSLVQLAQFPYCRAWRRECAARWGWRTPRFFACVERRGCGVY
jgi:hypothetical protein